MSLLTFTRHIIMAYEDSIDPNYTSECTRSVKRKFLKGKLSIPAVFIQAYIYTDAVLSHDDMLVLFKLY